MLPTDTQKNTAFAYAKLHGVSSPEDYALALGRRLLEATPCARTARRCASRSTPGTGPSTAGTTTRSYAVAARSAPCVVTVGRDATHVLSGLQDLVVLKSTGSEFKGFLVDGFTTLAEADDRILATSLTAGGAGGTEGGRRLERVVRRGAWRCCCRPSPRRTAARSRRRC